jgi:hypothetical protein
MAPQFANLLPVDSVRIPERQTVRKGIILLLTIQAGQVFSQFEADAVPHPADLFRAAVRLLLDQAAASDAVQETCLIAWGVFDRYERGTNCRACLLAILFNVVRRERRPANDPRICCSYRPVSDAQLQLCQLILTIVPVASYCASALLAPSRGACSNKKRRRWYARWAFCLTAPTVEDVARATSSMLNPFTLSMVRTSR